MKPLIIVLLSFFFIAGGEIIKRRFSIPTKFTRRVIHIGTASVAGFAPLLVSKEELVLICIAFVVILFLGRSSRIFSAIHAVERHTFGEIYLPVGVAITALLFLPNNLLAFQFGIFVMGISDALAGLVGERFGKHQFTILGNTKSLEGSLTFFISTLGITFLFVPTFSYSLIFIPIILALVELILVYGLDNLVLPIVGAYLFQLLILSI